MVWLHGGGNRSGSSADVYYDGTAFARDGVVLVSVNYRLGVFGFAAYGGEANFGLWDQIAALQWVRENIAAFGGDPANVTLFGESAGGEDTLALMTAKPARGLFQKAIVESGGGGWGPPPSVSDSTNVGALLSAADVSHAAMGGMGKPPATQSDASPGRSANASSATHSDALRSIPADSVVRQTARHEDWGPLIDGVLLTEPPLNAIAAGRVVRVPLIIGTNGEEGSILGPGAHADSVFPSLTHDDLARLKAIYGERAASDADLARLVLRDGYFTGPARWIALRLRERGVPVYMYRFEYVLQSLRTRRTGAHHGSEIPFVFEHWPTVPVSDDDRRVGHALHDCWVSFARTGAPTCADAGGWNRISGAVSGGTSSARASARSTSSAVVEWLVFDSHPSLRPIGDSPALDFLESRLHESPLSGGR